MREPPATVEADSMFVVTLPQRACHVCADTIPRRRHRVIIRASWRGADETLCMKCWSTICEWARRFALQQMVLDEAIESLKQT
jgi:hypothetical protein